MLALMDKDRKSCGGATSNPSNCILVYLHIRIYVLPLTVSSHCLWPLKAHVSKRLLLAGLGWHGIQRGTSWLAVVIASLSEL